MTSGCAPAARSQINVARQIGQAPQTSAASPKCRFARSMAASATENNSSSAPSSKESGRWELVAPQGRMCDVARRSGIKQSNVIYLSTRNVFVVHYCAQHARNVCLSCTNMINRWSTSSLTTSHLPTDPCALYVHYHLSILSGDGT